MNINRVGVTLRPGAESMGYELTSDLLSVTIADLGAHLALVTMRLDDNQELAVNVGYPPGAIDHAGFHGASVGRYANRIAGARFMLDDVTYDLDANDGANQLHGGSEGFGHFAWSADAETDGDTGRVVLRHKSKAGDMGFPGKVQATAIYELTGNQLTIDYRAKVSEPTPINLTNHAYWNLGDDGTFAGHTLRLAADRYVAVNEAKIPLPGGPAAVEDTRFDCRDGRDLSEVAASGGYDHSFVVDHDLDNHDLDNQDLETVATLSHASGRRIEVATNQIGVHVYTGQHLPADHQGVALETQCLPDTPNRPDFGDATVRPEDKYLASTTFSFWS